MNIIQWFDGKKTILAAILLTLAAFCSQVLIGIWHVDWTWISPLVDTFEWVGGILGGLGLTHKVMKSGKEVE